MLLKLLRVPQHRSQQAYTPSSYTLVINTFPFMLNASPTKNSAQRMTREPSYIPQSAKASDFKITLSKGASEDGERVSFLEQQIQQNKDTYESSLKNVIEECITLETTALQSQENDTIYTLLPSHAEAINTLEGITTDVHQKVMTLIYLDSTFFS